MIAWAAVALNYYDTHWYNASNEVALAAENARLEMAPEPFWKDDDKSFYMNFKLVNDGKSTALQMQRYGIAMVTTTNLDPDFIDAFFIMSKAKIKKANVMGNNEFPLGPTNQFFSVPDTFPGNSVWQRG